VTGPYSNGKTPWVEDQSQDRTTQKTPCPMWEFRTVMTVLYSQLHALLCAATSISSGPPPPPFKIYIS